MRATYDPEADAVYVYLVDEILPGGVSKSVPIDPIQIGGGIIVLDFDSNNKFLGIEVLDARSFLSEDFLASAEQLGGSH